MKPQSAHRRGLFAAFQRIPLCLIALSLVAAPSVAAAQQAGLYTLEQAERGFSVYRAECSTCHGADLRGAGGVPLVGDNFLGAWAKPGRSVDDLFYILKTTMPPGRSRDLSDAQHADVLAYILQKNGFASGNRELGSDPAVMAGALADYATVALEDRPPAPEFIAGEGGLEPTGRGPSQAELNDAASNTRVEITRKHNEVQHQKQPEAVHPRVQAASDHKSGRQAKPEKRAGAHRYAHPFHGNRSLLPGTDSLG